MPIPAPERSSKGSSFRISLKGIFCFVIAINNVIIMAASMALYSASSPDATAIFLTNGASVPKIAIDAASIRRDLLLLFINHLLTSK